MANIAIYMANIADMWYNPNKCIERKEHLLWIMTIHKSSRIYQTHPQVEAANILQLIIAVIFASKV